MKTQAQWWLWSVLCDFWLPYGGDPRGGPCRRTPRRKRHASTYPPHHHDPPRSAAPLDNRLATWPRLRHRKTRAHNLYENEDRSDVIFLVGDGKFNERIPAHSWVLSARNHFFRAMFHETWAERHKKVYNIPNDPKGFQNFLKWLYRQECGFQSLDSALTTLHVAIQYLCPELADLCAEYINQHLSVANVLKVMQQIHRYCPAPNIPVPTAPSLDVLEGRSKEALTTVAHDLGDETDLRDPSSCCSDLFNECLEILDRDASSVLASEGLEELDHETMEVILKRQTLGVQSEVEVVEAVVRWSTAQCKRGKLPLTQENRRQIIGGLLYYLRLLKLTPEQLSIAAKLLDKDEFEHIRVLVLGRTGRDLSPPPPTLAPYLKLMATARGPVSSAALPEPPPASGKKKKCSNKKRYTKKELMLDIVSCLAIIFD